MTWLVIAAVIVGVTLGDVGFYLGTGTPPGSALGKPMWSSLGLGVFGIAIALKERGAARWAFFGWALHQGLIALTPVGYGGWQPWVIRNVILLFSATLLIVAVTPISPRAQRIGIAVFVLAVSFTWLTKWSARQFRGADHISVCWSTAASLNLALFDSRVFQVLRWCAGSKQSLIGSLAATPR